MSIAFVEGYLSRYIDKGKQATILGVPVSELSKEALLGLVGFIGEEMKQQQENSDRTMNFLMDIKGVK